MVVIQCPHCYKDVELEDEASGLFDCPYCNNEFEYEPKQANVQHYSSIEPRLSRSAKTGLVLLIFSLLFLYFGSSYLNKATGDYNDSGVECEDSDSSTGGGDSVPGNPFSLEFWGIGNCSSEGDYGITSVCCSIILILLGFSFGVSGIITLISGKKKYQKVIIVQEQK